MSRSKEYKSIARHNTATATATAMAVAAAKQQVLYEPRTHVILSFALHAQSNVNVYSRHSSSNCIAFCLRPIDKNKSNQLWIEKSDGKSKRNCIVHPGVQWKTRVKIAIHKHYVCVPSINRESKRGDTTAASVHLSICLWFTLKTLTMHRTPSTAAHQLHEWGTAIVLLTLATDVDSVRGRFVQLTAHQ